MPEHLLLATLDENGLLTGVGRAHKVAIATVVNGNVEKWEEIDVKWDESHEQEYEGYHHASIVKFLQGHKIKNIVTFGAGEDIRRMLAKLGIKLNIASGNGRRVVEEMAKAMV